MATGMNVEKPVATEDTNHMCNGSGHSYMMPRRKRLSTGDHFRGKVTAKGEGTSVSGRKCEMLTIRLLDDSVIGGEVEAAGRWIMIACDLAVWRLVFANEDVAPGWQVAAIHNGPRDVVIGVEAPRAEEAMTPWAS